MFCQPTTEQSNAKPKQTRITFDAQLKPLCFFVSNTPSVSQEFFFLPEVVLLQVDNELRNKVCHLHGGV